MFSTLFAIVAVVVSVNAQAALHGAADKALEPLREHAGDLISMVLDARTKIGDPQGVGCTCTDSESCGCCATFYNFDGCVNITYVPATVSLNVVLLYNGQAVYNTTISATNPPPFCTGLPYKFASWCTIFSNLTITKNHFGGCLSYQLWILRRKVLEFPVGCFSWPPPSAHLALDVASDSCNCLPGKCQCCSQIRVAGQPISDRRCVKLLATNSSATVYLSHAGQLLDKAVIDGSADTRLCTGALCTELRGVIKTASAISGCIVHNVELVGRKVMETPATCFRLHLG